MAEQNRKTLRSFYCLDSLWNLFESQTHEYGVSMDYLINEAMTHYAEMQAFVSPQSYNQTSIAASIKNARKSTGGYGHVDAHAQSNFGQSQLGQSQLGQSQLGQSGLGQPNMGPPMNHGISQGPVQPQGPVMGSMAPMGPPMSHQVHPSMRNPAVSAPPPQRGFPPQTAPYPYEQAQSPPISQRSGNFAPPVGPGVTNAPWSPSNRPSGFGSQMQPPPQPPRPQQGPTGNLPVLYLYFDNNRYTIGTEDFVIGRGSQRTDLTIRDGNISRRHCAILHRNGAHYIKDLGSTNGVEFQGNRIESKKISEGDIYYICDYELRFSYQ